MCCVGFLYEQNYITPVKGRTWEKSSRVSGTHQFIFPQMTDEVPTGKSDM